MTEKWAQRQGTIIEDAYVAGEEVLQLSDAAHVLLYYVIFEVKRVNSLAFFEDATVLVPVTLPLGIERMHSEREFYEARQELEEAGFIRVTKGGPAEEDLVEWANKPVTSPVGDSWLG